MELLVVGVLGLLGIATATALGPRVRVSPPLLLVIVGILVSFLPFVPEIEIDPEWIIAGVLPPLLYSASVSMPSMEFRREFGAISEDELFYASPGDFLFFEEIRKACDDGLAFYDFSVGDAPYKRAWCDIETGHADVFAGLSARGKLLALLCFARTVLKRVVKQNPAMSRLARRALSLHAASRPGGAVGGT